MRDILENFCMIGRANILAVIMATGTTFKQLLTKRHDFVWPIFGDLKNFFPVVLSFLNNFKFEIVDREKIYTTTRKPKIFIFEKLFFIRFYYFLTFPRFDTANCTVMCTVTYAMSKTILKHDSIVLPIGNIKQILLHGLKKLLLHWS